MASGGWVLETAVRTTVSGSRPTARQASAIRARTTASLSEIAAASVDGDAEAGEEEVMILPAGYSDDARMLWDAATALNRAAASVSPAAARLPPLLFFTDPARTPRPWETAARLPPGSAVVYRAFGADQAVEIGRRLRAVTHEAGVELLVGKDADLADAVSADGLHLPERDADRAADVRRRRPDWRLTAAWHGAEPPASSVEALILSPVFPAGGASATKPALGAPAFKTLVQRAGVPVYALGGLRPDRVALLTGSGACGLAAVETIQSAFGGVRT